MYVLGCKVKNSQKGFTLMELIVGMMILVIIMAPLSTMISTYADVWLKSGVNGELRSVARTTMDTIQKDLTYATIPENAIANGGRQIFFHDERDNPTGITYVYELGNDNMTITKQRRQSATGNILSTVTIAGANDNLRFNEGGVVLFSTGNTNSSVVIDLSVRNTSNNETVHLKTTTNSLAKYTGKG